MALYLDFTARAPSLPDVSVDYPYITTSCKAYTTPDFQPATQTTFTITAASFSTDVPLTGVIYTAYGDVPDETYYTTGSVKHDIDGPLSYNTEYYFQAAITGYHPSHGSSGEVTSDIFYFTTEASPLPGQPTTPTPTNNDTEVDFSGFALSWVTGGNTNTYNVWIGPSGSLVEVSHEQEGTNYTTNIDEVPLNQKIYWRVDATNDVDTTTGANWNFDARPGKVSTTTPADEATGVTLHSTTGSWIAPSANTTSYRALYGTLSGFLEEVGTTSELSMDLVEGNFSVYGKISYWRVDAVNAFGTTAGDELYFTTMVFDPVLPTGVTLDHSGGEGGVPTGTPTGENNMMTVRRLVAAARNKIFYET